MAVSTLLRTVSSRSSAISSALFSSCVRRDTSAAGRSDALKSCVYTGIAYLITVALLVLPYLLLPAGSYAASLAVMLLIVVAIIALFNYYIAVAQGLSFRRRFGEMAAISLGVAALSFAVGLLVKVFLGVDV